VYGQRLADAQHSRHAARFDERHHEQHRRTILLDGDGYHWRVPDQPHHPAREVGEALDEIGLDRPIDVEELERDLGVLPGTNGAEDGAALALADTPANAIRVADCRLEALAVLFGACVARRGCAVAR